MRGLMAAGAQRGLLAPRAAERWARWVRPMGSELGERHSTRGKNPPGSRPWRLAGGGGSRGPANARATQGARVGAPPTRPPTPPVRRAPLGCAFKTPSASVRCPLRIGCVATTNQRLPLGLRGAHRPREAAGENKGGGLSSAGRALMTPRGPIGRRCCRGGAWELGWGGCADSLQTWQEEHVSVPGAMASPVLRARSGQRRARGSHVRFGLLGLFMELTKVALLSGSWAAARGWAHGVVHAFQGLMRTR